MTQRLQCRPLCVHPGMKPTGRAIPPAATSHHPSNAGVNFLKNFASNIPYVHSVSDEQEQGFERNEGVQPSCCAPFAFAERGFCLGEKVLRPKVDAEPAGGVQNARLLAVRYCAPRFPATYSGRRFTDFPSERSNAPELQNDFVNIRHSRTCTFRAYELQSFFSNRQCVFVVHMLAK